MSGVPEYPKLPARCGLIAILQSPSRRAPVIVWGASGEQIAARNNANDQAWVHVRRGGTSLANAAAPNALL
jgi:hypothetical protein